MFKKQIKVAETKIIICREILVYPPTQNLSPEIRRVGIFPPRTAASDLCAVLSVFWFGSFSLMCTTLEPLRGIRGHVLYGPSSRHLIISFYTQSYYNFLGNKWDWGEEPPTQPLLTGPSSVFSYKSSSYSIALAETPNLAHGVYNSFSSKFLFNFQVV